MSSDEVFTILRTPDMVVFSARHIGPAALEWAPGKNTFYLNDGKGSGMTSEMRLFSYAAGHIQENNDYAQLAIKDFRNRYACQPGTVDPNIWGLGWSKNGKELFAMAQTAPVEGCGKPEAIRGYVFDVGGVRIKEVLSSNETKRRFHRLLPQNVLNSR